MNFFFFFFGCFSIRITKSLTLKSGYQVQLRFKITQHVIDKVFISSFETFWGCGKVYFREDKVDFQMCPSLIFITLMRDGV